jgi:hypothetical protein
VKTAADWAEDAFKIHPPLHPQIAAEAMTELFRQAMAAARLEGAKAMQEAAAQFYETHNVRLATPSDGGKERYKITVRDLELLGSEKAMANGIRALDPATVTQQEGR